MPATITPAQAAKITGVHHSTVCRWCANGKVTATKERGRWRIDPASLARRIPIGADTLTAIGGNRWTKQANGRTYDRIYFNNWESFAGLDTVRYKSGNIWHASYQGEGISNSQARKIRASIDRLYFDPATGHFNAQMFDTRGRVASPQEVFDAAVSGIKAAAVQHALNNLNKQQ